MEENKNLSDEQAGIEPEPPEEFLDNSSSFMEEPGGENVPAPEQPLNDEPLNDLNKTMEVHHHTHPAHGKKNWKSYFWEFLMLFLAVFCGFLAEYQLEHKIEKERGMQYTHSFYDDLKTDTSSFSKLIMAYENKIKALENRGDCFDTINNNTGSSACLEELIMNSSHFPDMVYTDRTLQQLKNAGGLRLLNSADADSILLYDNMIKQFDVAEKTSFQETQTAIRNTLHGLVNYNSLRKKERPVNTTLIYAGNKALLNRYFNELETYTRYCANNITGINELKQKATTIINYFKEKYHYN